MFDKLFIKAAGKLQAYREAGTGLRVGLAFAPALVAFSNTAAYAQVGAAGSGDIIETTGFQQVICNVVNTLTGPLGIAIGVLVLAIGGLMIAFGGKRSVSFVIWGVIGVGLALAAPNLVFTLFPTTADSLCPTA